MSSEDPTQVFPKALEEIRLRLAALEEKVAQRGYDTRPIFEAHDRQLDELRGRIGELEKEKEEGKAGPLKYDGWAYFAEDGDGPFCRHCYESSDGERRSHVTGPDKDGDFYCTICKVWSRDPSRSLARAFTPPRPDPMRGF